MPNPVQSTKQIAIATAKAIARESNEILKSTTEQISGSNYQENQEQKSTPQEEKKEETDVAKLREHSQFMQEYRGELEQIRRDNLFKELQKKITEGETISIADYAYELNSDQREVLQAQILAVTQRQAKEEEAKKRNESIPQIVSKKARGMFGAIKKRNEQHVETRQPPST